MAAEGHFPCPSKASLQDAFLGVRLIDVPTPAAVLDRAVVRRNCAQMLQACEGLGVKFRAHVKTHSTYTSEPQGSCLRCCYTPQSLSRRPGGFESPICLVFEQISLSKAT